MINLYDSNETNFNNNGIGALKDVIKCEVTEALNGEFTIDFEYPKKSKYSNDIDNDMIIKIDTGSTERQLFRIKDYNENLSTITAKPQHISYDLIDNSLDDVFPQNLDGMAALQWILSHTQYKHKFTAFSNIAKKASARYVRKNPVEAILGDLDNSFVNVWGGEIERDNFVIRMLQQRGQDTGYKIKYKKNITGLQFNKDDSEVITRLRPMGYDGLMLPEKYIDSPLINNYPHPKIGEIVYSDIKLKQNQEDEEGYNTLEECYEELRNRAKIEFEENNIDKPKINVKVNFVDLSKTTMYEKYQFLSKIKLGDTVIVVLDSFEVKLRVIKTIYDSLLGRFTNLEIGEFKANYITDTQKNISNTVKKETENIGANILETAKQNATDLITKATNGYVVLRPSTNPTELLIMDTPDVKTATKIWRWNLNGLGYSKNGINGQYGLAITMDGHIVADFITSGHISGDVIASGAITADKIASDAIEAGKIKAGAVTADKIATDAVEAKHIKAGAITANDITSGTMKADRISGGTLTVGGSNNGNGNIQVKNSSDNIEVEINNKGIVLADGNKIIGRQWSIL